MLNWFRYFKNINYLTKTAIITALLFIVGLLTVFFKFGDSSVQITDGFYFALTCLIPGPMMFVAGIIYSLFFDLINGGFVFIPISILIHILMFLIIKMFKKTFTSYGVIPLAGLTIFIYVLYIYLINLNLGIDLARSSAIKELIIDFVQYFVSLIIGYFLFYWLSKPKIKDFLFK